MACLITPLITGIITSALNKVWKGAKKYRLDILSKILLGGSAILAVEHVYHGEVVPYPPFLTGAADLAGMLHEMSVVGGSMTLASLGLWASLLYATKKLEIRARPSLRITTTLEAR